jgi:hypothetical protein
VLVSPRGAQYGVSVSVSVSASRRTTPDGGAGRGRRYGGSSDMFVGCLCSVGSESWIQEGGRGVGVLRAARLSCASSARESHRRPRARRCLSLGPVCCRVRPARPPVGHDNALPRVRVWSVVGEGECFPALGRCGAERVCRGDGGGLRSPRGHAWRRDPQRRLGVRMCGSVSGERAPTVWWVGG